MLGECHQVSLPSLSNQFLKFLHCSKIQAHVRRWVNCRDFSDIYFPDCLESRALTAWNDDWYGLGPGFRAGACGLTNGFRPRTTMGFGSIVSPLRMLERVARTSAQTGQDDSESRWAWTPRASANSHQRRSDKCTTAEIKRVCTFLDRLSHTRKQASMSNENSTLCQVWQRRDQQESMQEGNVTVRSEEETGRTM